jgi:hypothetical protein
MPDIGAMGPATAEEAVYLARNGLSIIMVVFDVDRCRRSINAWYAGSL